MDRKSSRELLPFAGIKRAFSRLSRTFQEAHANHQRDIGRLEDAQEQYRRYIEAQKILQEIAKQAQEKAHNQIASIVTKCLRNVFNDDEYLFKIEFTSRRWKTDASMKVLYKDEELSPEDAAAGGEIDVIALALRIAALVFSVPKRRQLLVLDEPFRFVSKDFRPAVRELLQLLSRELKIQVIMVTHDTDFICGKVIQL